MIPKIGDIWWNKSRSNHYLILAEPCTAHMYDYKLLVLEDGGIDYASLLHFDKYCEKVA